MLRKWLKIDSNWTKYDRKLRVSLDLFNSVSFITPILSVSLSLFLSFSSNLFLFRSLCYQCCGFHSSRTFYGVLCFVTNCPKRNMVWFCLKWLWARVERVKRRAYKNDRILTFISTIVSDQFIQRSFCFFLLRLIDSWYL